MLKLVLDVGKGPVSDFPISGRKQVDHEGVTGLSLCCDEGEDGGTTGDQLLPDGRTGQ